MKMRVVAYARYSSNNQREESIDAQLRAIEEYAKQNNMLIIKTYIDRAMSGTKDDRPQFMQMIMDSKKKIFDAVIVPPSQEYCFPLEEFYFSPIRSSQK